MTKSTKNVIHSGVKNYEYNDPQFLEGRQPEAEIDPTNGELDESVDIKTTNTDGSQNTKPANPENTSTQPTYTPPPSADNPNPSPQPSGCA